MTDWTTLLEWVGIRWRPPSPVPQPATAGLLLERTTVRVPSEYRVLHTYLDRRYASVVVLTFEQIEALLGSPLPAPARSEPDWWTADAARLPHYSAAWTGAGRTAAPNLPAQTVTFERHL